MAKKKKKREKLPEVDGLGPKDIKRLMTAIARIWSWSYPRRLCIERSTDFDGFPYCEKCKERTPKNFIDHKVPRGSWDENYIKRTFCSSKGLQALCKSCHAKKTKRDNKLTKLKKERLK